MRVVKTGRGISLVRVHHCNNSPISLSPRAGSPARPGKAVMAPNPRCREIGRRLRCGRWPALARGEEHHRPLPLARTSGSKSQRGKRARVRGAEGRGGRAGEGGRLGVEEEACVGVRDLPRRTQHPSQVCARDHVITRFTVRHVPLCVTSPVCVASPYALRPSCVTSPCAYRLSCVTSPCALRPSCVTSPLCGASLCAL